MQHRSKKTPNEQKVAEAKAKAKAKAKAAKAKAPKAKASKAKAAKAKAPKGKAKRKQKQQRQKQKEKKIIPKIKKNNSQKKYPSVDIELKKSHTYYNVEGVAMSDRPSKS